MQPIRVKVCQESDLRMLGLLARNIQRVLPVTQADIDAAAALGKGWVVWKVIEVSDPLDNLRGGTQLIIKQNSVQPGQNVRRVIFVSGPGGETVVIGPAPSPLLLPDAIANSLSYVKAFGGTEQRNIPQPYTQVNYVTNTAQTAVDTGIMIDFAKNYEFEVECRATTGSWYILQSRASSSGNITGIHGATSGSTITLVVGNVTACTSAITRTVGNKLYVKATLNNGVATLYVKDETANTEDTQTGSYGTSQPNPTAAVYLLGNAGGQYADINSDIYMARIKENDTVVMDYVPARQVATAGFYDKASGTFKTALTPANLSADGNTVPTPDAPMDIVSNNGVVKYGVISNNLANVTAENVVVGKYITAAGTIADSAPNFYNSQYIKVKPNTTYTLSFSTQPFFASISEYDSTKTFIKRNGLYPGTTHITITTDSTTEYVRFGSNIFNVGTLTMEQVLAIEWMFNEGDVMPYEPYQEGIYTDGTVETINVHGKNLFDNSVTTQSGLFNAGDVIGTNVNYIVYDYQPIKAGTYILQLNNSATTNTSIRLNLYNNNKVFLSQPLSTNTRLVGLNIWTFTVAQDGYYRFNGRITDTNIQIEQGSTATTYEPYYDGGTAMAEMLLKIGDYQDEQEILSGVVTRNVGVKVLTGEENFETATATNCYSLTNTLGTGNFADRTIVCSHFDSTSTLPGTGDRQGLAFIVNKGPDYTIAFGATTQFSTQTQWKNWLAAQAAAGTPVIIVYPLATATTESVAGQTLQVTDGNNVLEITQASMSDLELEAEYEQGVQASVEEIEP